MPSLRSCASLAAALALALGAASATAAPHPPRIHPVGILVDSVHAHNALALPKGSDPYAYHNVYGFRRAFAYLKSQGVTIDELRTGRLSAARLAGHRILFINLVSADLPPFTAPEIVAVRRFVEQGGGVFVITDHSNCYYHAYKLMPLLEELGIRVTTETACDVPPNVLGDGNGWIAVTRFARHPVTRGLRAIGFQTGGTVDDRFSVAFTSAKAWGDQWIVGAYGEARNQGFYGNWAKDPAERSGPLGVVLAREFGRGRIVIVADQNVFGDPFLNYADNYRLWLNATAWLAGEPSLSDPRPYRAWRKPRIVAYEDCARAAWGNSAARGYYNLFVALGRRLWLFASSDLSGADLLLFAHDDAGLSRQARDAAVAHLKAGRNLVVLGPSPLRTPSRPALVRQLADALGAPREEQVYGNRTYTWTGCGRVFLLPRTQPFWNAVQPAPERAPNEDQRVFLDALARFLEGLAKPSGVRPRAR